MPRPKYKKGSRVSEKLLLEIIDEGNVESAIQVYNLLKDRTSVETKQNLLELLCFFNAKPNELKNLPITRWYVMHNKGATKTWSNDKLIQELYEFLITQDSITASKAQSTLICGMAKYFDVEKANALYTSCTEKNILLSIDAYNYMIQISNFIVASERKIKNFSLEILQTMQKQGVRPNVNTLNSALSVSLSMRNKSYATEYVKHMLKEFKTFDIHACLTSYYYILKAFQYTENIRAAFTDILDALEASFPTPQNENDFKFFPTAMIIACEDLMDMNIATRLHKLYLTNDNAKFITTYSNENIYYRLYFTLKLNVMPFEEFFTFYKSIVPHTWIPESKIYYHMLHVLNKNTSYIATHLPQLWSDLLKFDMVHQEDLTNKVIDMMYNHCLTPESPVNQVFGTAAYTVWEYSQRTAQKQLQKMPIGATVLGNIIVLLGRAKEFEKMGIIISSALQNSTWLSGELSSDHVMELFQICITENLPSTALDIMEYIYTCDIQHTKLSVLGKRLHNALELTVEQRMKLVSLVGESALNANVSEDL